MNPIPIFVCQNDQSGRVVITVDYALQFLKIYLTLELFNLNLNTLQF